MSKPTDGNYYIVNRETTSDGTLLALQYNGNGALLTVTEFGSQPTQVWTLVSDVSSETESQAICPQDAPSLQACRSGIRNLTVSPADNYTWIIRETDGIYTIQGDRDLSYFFWRINRAAVGQDVHYVAGSESATQYWKLISA